MLSLVSEIWFIAISITVSIETVVAHHLQTIPENLVGMHEKLDLHKFTRCKFGAKKCKLRLNKWQRW